VGLGLSGRLSGNVTLLLSKGNWLQVRAPHQPARQGTPPPSCRTTHPLSIAPSESRLDSRATPPSPPPLPLPPPMLRAEAEGGASRKKAIL
jgi:hypothetical protein